MHRKTMLYTFSFICLFSLIIVVPAVADTIITLDIFTSTTWTAANSPYVISGGIDVKSTTANNITVLTIQPGVMVKFLPNATLTIGGYDTINRAGLMATGIRFTSYQVIPAAGDWDYIYFTQYSERW